MYNLINSKFFVCAKEIIVCNFDLMATKHKDLRILSDSNNIKQ